MFERCPVCDADLQSSLLTVGDYYCGSCREEWTWAEVSGQSQLAMVWLSDENATFSATVPKRKLACGNTITHRGQSYTWTAF